jgi:hypothetical protein
MSLGHRVVVPLVLLCVVTAPGSALASEHSTRQPVKGLLLRLDVSAVGTFTQDETSFSVDAMGGDPEQLSFSSTGVAVGPKALVNLGFAPSRLVRLGAYAAIEGAPQFSLEGSIPNVSVDGHLRISVGPSVGFRFGPKTPLELELGLGVVRQQQMGMQTTIGSPDNRYPLGADKWGGEGGVKLFVRPGGAGDAFAFHVGLLGGLTVTSAGDTDTKAVLGGVELGVSLGL